MHNFRGTFVNKNRDAWVEINLSNLENNVCIIKEYLAQHCKTQPELFAVIKADGYGHGSLMCAPTLVACGVTYFGVASIDEGIELLTGVPAGKRDGNGRFPAGSVNYLAYEKLKKYAEISKKHN